MNILQKLRFLFGVLFLLLLPVSCESQNSQETDLVPDPENEGSYFQGLISMKPVDGFEGEFDWFVEESPSQWVTDATHVCLDKQFATEGEYSLAVDIDITKGIGRAHIKRSFENQLEDWSDYNYVYFDLIVDQPCSVRLGLHGPDWVYEQTESVFVKAGSSRNVSLFLDSISPHIRKNFKLLTIEFKNYKQSQRIYLDRLRVAKIETEQDKSGHPIEGNLAYRCKFTVSSTDEERNLPERAVDGSRKTRWSSKYTDKQYWILDFGKPVDFNTIVFFWEAAFPSRYDLFTSLDQMAWTPLYRMEGGLGGIETLTTETQHARYLKWEGRGRGTPWGYSLYEVEVYQKPDQPLGFNREAVPMNRILPVLNFHPLENRNPIPPQSPEIKNIDFPQGKTVGKYEKIEFEVDFEASWSNPYDPDEIDVIAVLKSPTGKTYQVPGFYYWPFERKVFRGQEQLESGEQPLWRVRFSPSEEGSWSGFIRIRNKQGETSSEPFSFQCEPSDRPGFIQVAEKNPDYFEFQNGDLFFPVGANVCWFLERPGEGNLQTLAYDRWLEKLADNGVNYIRLWMWPQGFCPEWYDTGLGDYDLRQPNLWRLDYVFSKCEALGIHIMLSLINHGQFSSRTNAEWDSNPYSAENGGMLESPEQFLTNLEAKQLFSRRLRYLMARYAYSPNLFAWEWFNEVEWTDGLAGKEFIPWMEEMAGVIRKYDPNPHLITTSSRERGSSNIWDTPTLDFTQVHQYGCRNWAPEISKQIRFMKEKYKRPVFYGRIWTGSGRSPGRSKGNPPANRKLGIFDEWERRGSDDLVVGSLYRRL